MVLITVGDSYRSKHKENYVHVYVSSPKFREKS